MASMLHTRSGEDWKTFVGGVVKKIQNAGTYVKTEMDLAFTDRFGLNQKNSGNYKYSSEP